MVRKPIDVENPISSCLWRVNVVRWGIWSNGYFVSTVGVNENIIRKYIERQGQEDIGQEIVIS